jgi:mono/diheme cytochrome c family protein
MRVIAALPLVLLAACGETKKPPPAPVLADAAPPPVEKAAPLAVIEGASAENGKAGFAAACASCHGADARGRGPEAAKQPFPPTDLTRDSYLCRSTFGRAAMPSDADLEATLARGPHAGLALDPAARRSFVLYVKTLAPGFSRPAAPILAVPPEPPDTAEERGRGRALYLGMGCWACHGVSGDGDPTGQMAWNGVRVTRLKPLSARDGWMCGDDAARVYRTLALGMGTLPAVMPQYLSYARNVAHPDGDPTSWTRPLEGKAAADELAAVRAWFAAQPPKAEVHKLDAAALDARSAATLWSLVHYVRSR